MNDEDVFKKYSRQIYVTALTYVKNRSDAEDILQDVFVKFLSEKRPFESEEHAKNWLLKVAVNRAKNILRSSWFRKTDGWEEQASLSHPDPAQAQTLALDLRDAVMRLPEKYRLAVVLYYYDSLSVRDAALVAGVSEEAFRLRLHRARLQLRTILGECYDEEFFG